MLSETDIYWYASWRGWTACFDFLHSGEYVRGVFLERGTRKHFWGPLGAVQRLSMEEFFAYMGGLEESEPLQNTQTFED